MMYQENTRRGKTQKNNKVIPNLIWNLQRLPLSFLNNLRGRSRIKYGMTSLYKDEALNKDDFRAPLCSGFTLIELLVVVLIIGILAAVALPQYQKAVLKTHLSKGMPLVEALYNAQQVYFLTHGEFATDIDDLEVGISQIDSCTKTQNASTSVYTCPYGTIGMYDGFSNVQYLPVKEQVAYLHYLKDFEAGGLQRKAGEIWCFARIGNSLAQQVCQGLGGDFKNSNSTWMRYKIK